MTLFVLWLSLVVVEPPLPPPPEAEVDAMSDPVPVRPVSR